jgi:hypothetical protein
MSRRGKVQRFIPSDALRAAGPVHIMIKIGDEDVQTLFLVLLAPH